MLLYRRPWARQPQPGAWAALSDAQLARGLTSLWSATLPLIDISNKRAAGTVAGTWAPSSSVTGVGYRGNAAGSNRLEFTGPASANSTDYTVWAYVNDDAGSGVIRNPIDGDLAGERVFQLRFKADDGVEFITFDTLGNPYFASGAAISFAPRVGLLVGRIVGNTVSVWWQGKQYATGSASNTAATIAAKKLTVAASYAGSLGGGLAGFPGQVFLAGHYNCGLGDAEIVALSRNPWQLFAPVPRRLWAPAASGAGSHAATGGLAAAAATIAGSATHLTLHTSSGAMAAEPAAIAGTAAHLTLHTSSGALVAGSATMAGTALHPHAATGALVAGAATIAGAAARAATGTHAATGALAADAAVIAGVAARLALHTATGALVAGATSIAGTAAHAVVHAASGALVAGSAQISGAASGPIVVLAGADGASNRRRRWPVIPKRDDEPAAEVPAQEVAAPAPKEPPQAAAEVAPAAPAAPKPPRLAQALPAVETRPPQIDFTGMAEAVSRSEAALLADVAEQRRRRVQSNNRAAMAAAELLLLE